MLAALRVAVLRAPARRTPAPARRCLSADTGSRHDNKDFWESLCPQLSLEGPATGDSTLPAQLPRTDGLRRRLIEDGYFHVGAEQVPWSASLPCLVTAAGQIAAAGWPSSFLIVYREPWLIAHELADSLRDATGGTHLSCDWQVVSVDGTENKAGWSNGAPHRDRSGATVHRGFGEDGCPLCTTVWIPLTAATTENSCLYVLPKNHDPGYGVEEPAAVHDHIFDDGFAVQAIRALPCASGAVICMSHRLLHWGSLPQSFDGVPTPPRVALSFGTSAAAFEAPFLRREHLPVPPFELRLALAAAQQIRYSGQTGLTAEMAGRCFALFVPHVNEFDEGYTRAVFLTYMHRYLNGDARVLEQCIEATATATAAHS
jgi:hypothetical protein